MTTYSTANGITLSTSGSTTRWAINTSGGETQVGTSGNDAFSGAGGDVLIGGLGDDTYYLWDNRETVVEQAGQGVDTVVVNYWGAATLAANVENLILNSPGANSGTGNALNNIIIAGSVGATLDGGAGNDILVGGAGADLFIVKAGNGSDAIVNFAPSNDVIKLQGYGITSFDQLAALATQNGADVKFAFANGESLVLRNVSLSSLSAYDFGMLPSSPASLTALSQMVGPAKALTMNGWTIVNNVWNPGSLAYGTDYSVSTAYSAGDLTKQTTFSWSFPIVIDPNPTIRAYQEISYGLNPYASTSSSPANPFAIQLSSLSSLEVKYDVEYHGNLAGFDVAFDLWLTSRPNGNASTITNEVMIWLHKGGLIPFGSQVGTYSDGVISAKIYYQAGARPYTAVVLDTDSTSGDIDIASILAKLVSLNLVSSSEYLASLEFGAEVGSGAGALTIHSLDLSVGKADAAAAAAAAPLAPTITASLSDNAGLANGLTKVNHVTLSGTAAAGTVVQILDGSSQIGTAVAGSSGAWSFATGTLADGSHGFTAKAVDGSGNASAMSSSFNVIVDTTAPVAPAITSFSPDSYVAGDGVTNANQVTLNGSAEQGSTVKLFDGATLIGTVVAGANGSWSYTTSTLSDATHSFSARSTDAAGNVSAMSPGFNITVDTVAPRPTVTSFSPDSNVVGDGITNANQITLRGTGEVGRQVQVFDGANQIGTASVDGTGAWTFATATLANGVHSFTTKQTDAAGNVGTSAALSVTVDTIGPGAPVISSSASVSASSTSVSGTAEAGAKVWLYDGANLLGTGVAAANGSWTIGSGALVAGIHTLTAVATDTAGNSSGVSNALNQIVGTVMESTGTTTLATGGTNYYLSDGGAALLLKYSGAAVQTGQFGAFTAIAAEKTASGYDVAWKAAGSDQYMVWSVDANGAFTANLTGTVSGASSALQALESVFHQDLNGDGVIGQAAPQVIAQSASVQIGTTDLVFFNNSSHTAAIWQVGGPSQGSPQVVAGASGSNFAAKADFNGDGLTDLLFINSVTHEVSELLSNGAQAASAVTVGSINTASGWHFADIVDFNADGKSDLLFVNSATNGIAVWQMDGAKIAAGPQIGVMAQGFHIASTGDFNGDGKTDLFMINDNTHDAMIWQMNGTQVASKTTIATINVAGGWDFVGTGDFNGDGKTDLLFLNEQTHGVATWQMNGNQITSGSQIAVMNAAGGWRFADVGDFNGDGKSDLLFLNDTTHGVAAWEMNGTKIMGSAVLGTVGADDHYVGLQSIDGGQKSAILFENSVTHALTAVEINGGQGVLQQLGVMNADAGWHLAI
ncbi:Ig-like domain-containing protein [Bradyrhizobium sp. 930_D9_N1_4]|uniref:Ig-like domain-containing protein n=1 Tax=Bradyrhizobium sp. 930_D9_N1_4 TaxID=3240374 RepID=UPI003F88982A